MAVQQRRNSKTRKAKRRTHYKLAAPTLVNVQHAVNTKCLTKCVHAVSTTVKQS